MENARNQSACVDAYERGYELYQSTQYQEALNQFNFAAEAGYPPAYVMIDHLLTHKDLLGLESQDAAQEKAGRSLIKNLSWFKKHQAPEAWHSTVSLGYINLHGIGTKEKLSKSMRYFQDALNQRPNDLFALYQKCLCLTTIIMKKFATRLHEDILEDPYNFPPLSSFILREELKGRMTFSKEAFPLDVCKQMLEIDPNNLLSLTMEYAIYICLQDFDRALVSIDKVLMNNPQNATHLLLQKSDIFFELSRYEECLSVLNRILRNNDKNLEALKLKHQVLFMLDDNQQSLETYESIKKIVCQYTQGELEDAYERIREEMVSFKEWEVTSKLVQVAGNGKPLEIAALVKYHPDLMLAEDIPRAAAKSSNMENLMMLGHLGVDLTRWHIEHISSGENKTISVEHSSPAKIAISNRDINCLRVLTDFGAILKTDKSQIACIAPNKDHQDKMRLGYVPHRMGLSVGSMLQSFYWRGLLPKDRKEAMQIMAKEKKMTMGIMDLVLMEIHKGSNPPQQVKKLVDAMAPQLLNWTCDMHELLDCMFEHGLNLREDTSKLFGEDGIFVAIHFAKIGALGCLKVLVKYDYPLEFRKGRNLFFNKKMLIAYMTPCIWPYLFCCLLPDQVGKWRLKNPLTTAELNGHKDCVDFIRDWQNSTLDSSSQIEEADEEEIGDNHDRSIYIHR